jgi:hypothetical protein
MAASMHCTQTAAAEAVWRLAEPAIVRPLSRLS